MTGGARGLMPAAPAAVLTYRRCLADPNPIDLAFKSLTCGALSNAKVQSTDC